MEDDPGVGVNPTSTKPTTLIALRHGGTHLIQPLIRHLTGRAVYVPKGDLAITCVPGPRLIVFLRDPRNRAVSHFRYKRPGAKAGQSDAALARLLGESKRGETPLRYMLRWARRWARDPTALIVRFERLVADPRGETERIRTFLDASGNVAEAVEYTFGKSGTWTGRHSRWPEWFGPETHRVWASQGGAELLELMGYADA